MKRRESKYIQILSTEAKVPADVQKKADIAYSIIQAKSKEIEYAGRFRKANIYNKKRIALLIAALSLLFASTAFAAIKHMGLADFFAKSGKQLPGQASSMIETNIKQDKTNNNLVSFNVREAICDNQTITAVIEAIPVAPDKYLLIATDTRFDDSVSNMGIETENNVTLVEYAAAENKQLLHVSPSLSYNGTNIMQSVDYTTENDGTVVFIIKGDNILELDNISLTCDITVYPIDYDGNYGEIIKDSFDFILTNKSTQVTANYKPIVAEKVKDTGVIVDKIILKKTELGIYTELTFHLSPDATEDQIALAKSGLWFEYLDDSGNVWESGLSSIGEIEQINESVFVQKNDFMDRMLPDVITVRAYDCWEKTRFGTVTFNKE